MGSQVKNQRAPKKHLACKRHIVKIIPRTTWNTILNETSGFLQGNWKKLRRNNWLTTADWDNSIEVVVFWVIYPDYIFLNSKMRKRNIRGKESKDRRQDALTYPHMPTRWPCIVRLTQRHISEQEEVVRRTNNFTLEG